MGLAVKTVLDNMEDGTGWGAQGAAVEDNSELFTEDPVTKAGATSAAASRRDTAEVRVLAGVWREAEGFERAGKLAECSADQQQVPSSLAACRARAWVEASAVCRGQLPRTLLTRCSR